MSHSRQSTEDHKSNTRESRRIVRNEILAWEKKKKREKSHGTVKLTETNPKLDRAAGLNFLLCTIYPWEMEVKNYSSETWELYKYGFNLKYK